MRCGADGRGFCWVDGRETYDEKGYGIRKGVRNTKRSTEYEKEYGIRKGVRNTRSISTLQAAKMHSEGFTVQYFAAALNPGRFDTLELGCSNDDWF